MTTWTVLITGCNTGIGLELARHCLSLDATLHFTCRSSDKVITTTRRLRADFPRARVEGHVLDLARDSDIQRLADELDDRGLPIDTLILNAGVHVPFGARETAEGVELHRQVNFLAPARLFVRLVGSGRLERVLYVSSQAHQRGALPAVFPLSFWARYARSKLLATTFFLTVRPLFPDVRIAVHSPGSVETDVDRHKPAVVRWMRRRFGGGAAAADAAALLVSAAFFSDAWEAYHNRGHVDAESPRCHDAELQLAVWNEVTGPGGPAGAHGTVGRSDVAEGTDWTGATGPDEWSAPAPSRGFGAAGPDRRPNAPARIPGFETAGPNTAVEVAAPTVRSALAVADRVAVPDTAPDGEPTEGISVVPPRTAARGMEVVENHAGTLNRIAPAVHTPATEEELASIVARARAEGRPVRAVGSRHSYNDCFYSESTMVSLARFDEIGAIDAYGATVTVGAGVTVQKLCDHLDAHGYALRWAGNSGRQTLVGAAITGTHGYAREGGLLAELITAARIVTGRGEVRDVSDETELRALRVSLGTLGLVTRVTLSLVPAGTLVRYALDTVDEAEFLDLLTEAPRRHEYFRFFPNRYHPDRFSVLTIDRSWETPPADELERVRYIDKTAAPRPVVALLRHLMRSTLMHRVLKRLPAPRLRMSFVAPFSTLLFVNAGVVNRWYRLSGLVYQAWNDDRTRNMEVAIRPEDFGSFLRVFRQANRTFRKDIGPFSSYFTGRYAGGNERTLLGPNHRRDVIFVDVHVTKGPAAKSFLQHLEAGLRDAMPLRAHWGKEFFLTGAEVKESYPPAAWAEFTRMKRHFDPDNVFTNGYTKRVFGW